MSLKHCNNPGIKILVFPPQPGSSSGYYSASTRNGGGSNGVANRRGVGGGGNNGVANHRGVGDDDGEEEEEEEDWETEDDIYDQVAEEQGGVARRNAHHYTRALSSPGPAARAVTRTASRADRRHRKVVGGDVISGNSKSGAALHKSFSTTY
jgi:hypothetical protein